jgi:hypothetical protein
MATVGPGRKFAVAQRRGASPLQLDTCRSDHLGPFVGVFRNVFAEFVSELADGASPSSAIRCRNALELPGESTQALPKRGRKCPEFEIFPVVFPVGRERERAPIQQKPVFLR